MDPDKLDKVPHPPFFSTRSEVPHPTCCSQFYIYLPYASTNATPPLKKVDPISEKENDTITKADITLTTAEAVLGKNVNILSYIWSQCHLWGQVIISLIHYQSRCKNTYPSLGQPN